MPCKEILRIGIFIHVTVISYFRLQLVYKSASRKMLGLKLVKLDFIITYLDFDTIKKARYFFCSTFTRTQIEYGKNADPKKLCIWIPCMQ